MTIKMGQISPALHNRVAQLNDNEEITYGAVPSKFSNELSQNRVVFAFADAVRIEAATVLVFSGEAQADDILNKLAGEGSKVETLASVTSLLQKGEDGKTYVAEDDRLGSPRSANYPYWEALLYPDDTDQHPVDLLLNIEDNGGEGQVSVEDSRLSDDDIAVLSSSSVHTNEDDQYPSSAVKNAVRDLLSGIPCIKVRLNYHLDGGTQLSDVAAMLRAKFEKMGITI